MTDKSFADECRHRFMVATHSEKITPFHKDKRKYRAEAEAALDDYNDYLAIEGL